MIKTVNRLNQGNGYVVPLAITPVIDITHLISLFSSNTTGNYKFHGERHDFWEFVFVEKGDMLVTANTDSYILKAGEMAFHTPGEFHAIESTANGDAEYMVGSFISESPVLSYFNQKILSLNGKEREMLYMALGIAKVALPFFYRVTPEYYEKYDLSKIPVGSEQMMRNSLENMLLHLYQRKNGNHVEKRMESYAQQMRKKRLAAEVESYLQAHLSSSLKLEELAQEMNYSVSQLQKFFKNETGQSIISFFIDLKITRAKQLIQKGNDNFSQISAKLGYHNVNYFSRLFKMKTGITLTEYADSID